MLTNDVAHPAKRDLRVGDLVEVRSLDEILATLDENGELESLPFMPEMVQYCGQRLTVHKVAHKLCDVITNGGMRRMERAVHLTAARCDGSAHGGCQNECLLYFKEAWLKKVEPGSAGEPVRPHPGQLTLPLLAAATRKAPFEDGAPRYSCQATEILRAAPQCLPLRELGQYVEDVRSGNVGVLWALRAFLIGLFNRVQSLSRKVLPRGLQFREGLPWGFLKGRLVGRTPTGRTNLQPGELVRIKSKQEILETLNQDLFNRGLGFESEMARHCGRVARVRRRVDRCLNEKTGRLLTMKEPCIVLEDVFCDGAYSQSCPRAYRPFWREIWLERINEPAAPPVDAT